MENALKLENSIADDITPAVQSLTERRLAKGYGLEDLAVATGLTISEICAAEDGNAPRQHVERIEHALR